GPAGPVRTGACGFALGGLPPISRRGVSPLPARCFPPLSGSFPPIRYDAAPLGGAPAVGPGVLSSWLPVLVLVGLQAGGLRRAARGTRALVERLYTQTVSLPSAELVASLGRAMGERGVLRSSTALPGGAQVQKGGRVLNPGALGPALTLVGLGPEARRAEFLLAHPRPALEGPLYRSRCGGLALCCLRLGLPLSSQDAGECWVVFSVEQFERCAAKEGAREALAAAAEGGRAIAVAPPGTSLASAPALGWREYCAESSDWVVREGAGLSKVQAARLPARARVLAAGAPRRAEYRHSYFEVFERPGRLWGCCVVALQVLQWLLVRRASTRKLCELVVGAMSRAKWLATITCTALCAQALVSRWKQRRSRGKAIESDILGSQSSQQEARLTAVTIALKALSWIVWLLCVMAVLGINIGRVLLVPSVGAIFLGFLGQDIFSNVLSGLVVFLTQPFAQGDWITLEKGQTGWVHHIGLFYTKVVLWDKRPLYVPNARLIQMLVQNNSRMSHRRIRFDINVRLKDVPKVPAIVKDLQGMLEQHQDLDCIQHKLVRWRQVGDYYATVWLSCYTKSTEEGIRTKHFIAVEQSVLERTAAILYKHGADFATSLERSTSTALEAAEAAGPARSREAGREASGGELRARERVLRESREEALRAKEAKVRATELRIDGLQGVLEERARELEAREERLRAALELRAAGLEGGPGEPEADQPQALDRAARGEASGAGAAAAEGAKLEPELRGGAEPAPGDALQAMEDEVSERSRAADRRLQELSRKSKELSRKGEGLERAAQEGLGAG
ncbi:unnamed protein product, partial [Prorocentrum cordatum]